ncbi:type II toxin-antitoxin system Phd/YefM family antitoxin [Streptoalloteichus hindustanus]|uniref:type II toxin-antitoxin system Phd/YefM family antitoxin n=1 Tax=Streptoalloteichus hindustanus TaxID=2017 RepID=UPI0009368999|nr:type II toxin-antitoxin system prevent-host-death family antitoxin [Streptoalloteichus hindustanus]
MDQVGVRELNQATSKVLGRVREGHPVTVTERGVPVAHLIPVQAATSLLGQLVATGRAVPPRTPRGPIPLPPRLGSPDVNVAAELAEAREDERW